MQPLESLYSGLYEPLKLRGKTDNTRRQYRYMLAKLALFLGRAPADSDLNDRTAADLLAWMAERDYAPRSINNVRAYLLAFWRFLARKRIVEQWPDVELWPEPETIPMAWTGQQLQALFASCALETGHVCDIPAALYWLAIHFVWWDTGERFTATLSTRWEGLDFVSGDLMIPAEVRKGRKKGMVYRLQPDTLELLQAIQEPKRDLIFPWDRDQSTFYNHYERILKRAGLPYDRNCKPQRMRRSFASHLEANGGNATDALDHASRRTTKKSYLDPRITRKTAPSDLLPRPADAKQLLKDTLGRAGPCQKKTKPNEPPKRNAKGA